MSAPFRGAVCGAFATGVLPLTDWAIRRALGREPVFAPRRLAASAAWHLTGREPGLPVQHALGWAMRALYTPSLGVGLGFLRCAFHRRPLVSALALTGAITVGERLALPGLKLTPPLRRWSPRERALLPFHALSFALTAAALEARLGDRARGSA